MLQDTGRGLELRGWVLAVNADLYGVVLALGRRHGVSFLIVSRVEGYGFVEFVLGGDALEDHQLDDVEPGIGLLGHWMLYLWSLQ